MEPKDKQLPISKGVKEKEDKSSKKATKEDKEEKPNKRSTKEDKEEKPNKRSTKEEEKQIRSSPNSPKRVKEKDPVDKDPALKRSSKEKDSIDKDFALKRSSKEKDEKDDKSPVIKRSSRDKEEKEEKISLTKSTPRRKEETKEGKEVKEIVENKATPPVPPRRGIQKNNQIITTLNLFNGGFLKYLNDTTYSDVLLQVANKEYYSHRLLLSYHSQYFLNLFKDGPYASSTVNENEPDQRAKISIKDQYFILELSLKDKELNTFPIVLNYMYGKDIELCMDIAFPLLLLARKFSIESLRTLVQNYIVYNINKDNAIVILKKAIECKEKRVKKKCIGTVARNFHVILEGERKVNLNFLPYNLFLALLENQYLCVNEEYMVYLLIKSYLSSKHGRSLNGRQKHALFANVRFPYLQYDELEKVIKDKLAPESLIAEALLHRLAKFEAKSPINHNALPLRLKKRVVRGRLFEYKSNQDGNGVIYYLATNGGKSEWKNPSLSAVIKFSSSSVEKGRVHYIVEKDALEFWTKDIPSSWVSVDLRNALIPKNYTLRHGANSRMDALRNWVLQGSIDDQSWTDISRHTNDTSLNAEFAIKTWEIKDQITPYRYFRILQIGHNSGGNNFLALSGIEFYGELHEVSTLGQQKSKSMLVPMVNMTNSKEPTKNIILLLL